MPGSFSLIGIRQTQFNYVDCEDFMNFLFDESKSALYVCSDKQLLIRDISVRFALSETVLSKVILPDAMRN
jgi:hypothetical protein